VGDSGRRRQDSGRYVVVGASGILAPLGAMLRSRAVRTVGISRGSRLDQGMWDERVALDTRDVTAVTDWLAQRWTDRGTDGAAFVAYSTAMTASTWPLLEGLAEHIVVVATSEWADPGSSVSPPWSSPPAIVVQLGWVQSSGGSRWHTSIEVSVAVADVLFEPPEPRTVVLGSIRPWSSRPR